MISGIRIVRDIVGRYVASAKASIDRMDRAEDDMVDYYASHMFQIIGSLRKRESMLHDLEEIRGDSHDY